jgi:hypothetical protein
MTDEHHDNRYEDGDTSTGTVEDYVDWTKSVRQTHAIAKNLRCGDVIEYKGQQVMVEGIDNVDGFVEIVTVDRQAFFVRWDKLYAVFTPNV